MDVDDLAPEVCPTRDLDDPFAVEFVEAGIGIGLQEATVRRSPIAGRAGMARILGDQHVRQEPRSRPAALDRQRRHRRLVHALAGAAGEAGTDVPDHLEPRRLVVENFRDVLTDDVQLAAARRTAAAIRFMPALLPAANDRAVAAGHFSSRNRLLAPSPVRGRASPAMRRAVPRLQAQRRLIGMALLRGAAEALPFQRREEQLQLLDFAVPIGQPWLRLRQLGVLPFQHVCQITHHPSRRGAE